MINIELIARAIITRGDTILLCKNNIRGHFYLPGGHVEFGDSLLDTIYKELYEETGLMKDQISSVTYKNFLENVYGEDASKHHELNMIFIVTIDDSIEIISQEPDISFSWISLSDISTVTLLPKGIEKIII